MLRKRSPNSRHTLDFPFTSDIKDFKNLVLARHGLTFVISASVIP